MRKLLFLLSVLVLGFVLGIRYDRQLMQDECKAGAGECTGTICVNSELLQ